MYGQAAALIHAELSKTTNLDTNSLAKSLSAVLSRKEPAATQKQLPGVTATVAALGGPVPPLAALASAQLAMEPLPPPLPPQTLVDLPSTPLCVGEARRLVLGKSPAATTGPSPIRGSSWTTSTKTSSTSISPRRPNGPQAGDGRGQCIMRINPLPRRSSEAHRWGRRGRRGYRTRSPAGAASTGSRRSWPGSRSGRPPRSRRSRCSASRPGRAVRPSPFYASSFSPIRPATISARRSRGCGGRRT